MQCKNCLKIKSERIKKEINRTKIVMAINMLAIIVMIVFSILNADAFNSFTGVSLTMICIFIMWANFEGIMIALSNIKKYELKLEEIKEKE